MRPRVLLAESDAERRRLISDALAAGFECRQAVSAEEAMRELHAQEWAAVIAAHDLGVGGSGLEILQASREIAPRAFRLFIGDLASPGLRWDVQQLAQPHYLTNARGPGLIAGLVRALARLLDPPSSGEAPGAAEADGDSWSTCSPMGLDFLRELKAAAEQDAPVFLYGEPASGVECAARRLRQWRREWWKRGSPGAPADPAPVVVLRVPSLRERPQDLPLLAGQWLREQARRNGQAPRALAGEALEVLLARTWRGNLDELHGTLAAAAGRAGARPVIEAADLRLNGEPPMPRSHQAKDEGQRLCLLRQLRAARSVSGAARLEHCTRANYIRLMRRLGILRADVGAHPAARESETAPPGRRQAPAFALGGVPRGA